MSRGRILLVTGSRALDALHGGSPQSEEWAKLEIRRKLLAGFDFAVHGGAVGPDTWVDKELLGSLTRALVFRPSGWIYLGMEQYKRWRAEPGWAHPLDRDRKMVEHVKTAASDGWHVEALGLVAPWSRTHGTDFTLRLATEAGLTVTRLECPAEYQGRQK